MPRHLLVALFVFALTGALVLSSFAPAFARDVHDKNSDKKSAAAKSSPLPFEPNEELVYQGEFSKLLLRGIEIAEFRFKAGRITPQASASAVDADAAQPLIQYQGDAKAKGWFRKLFGVDFHFGIESVVDPRTLAVLSTSKIDEQGKRVRLSEAVFDRANDKVTFTERNPNDPNSQPEITTSPLGGAAHDFLSALYFLRTRPLAVGQRFEIVMSDSGEVFNIPVKVSGRKTMNTIVGKKTQTLRVDIEAFGDRRLIRRNGEMSLWLTDDERRLPVRVRIGSDIGTIDIKLKRVTGGIAAAGQKPKV
ncbi:MAG: DUF3108 domain-containing protein [Pyrinomonadaceae bacterium]